MKDETYRATFEVMHLPGKLAKPPKGPFAVEVYSKHLGVKVMRQRWYARLLPTLQTFPDNFKTADEAMCYAASKFERCTEVWKKH